MIARRLAELRQGLRELRQRVLLSTARAVLRLTDDGGGLQQLQVGLLKDETRDRVEYPQDYGLTSRAFPGAEAVVVFLGGNRDHPLAIQVADRRYRLKGLRTGEVALYDDQGQSIWITRDGIVIDGAALPVKITNTPKVRMETSLLEVTGDIKDQCQSQAQTLRQMRDTYNGHHHPDPQGGATSPPSERQG